MPKVVNHGMYSEPVVVHDVLYGVSGRDSWCDMLKQWL